MHIYYSNSSNIRIVLATNIRIPKYHYSPNPNINSISWIIRNYYHWFTVSLSVMILWNRSGSREGAEAREAWNAQCREENAVHKRWLVGPMGPLWSKILELGHLCGVVESVRIYAERFIHDLFMYSFNLLSP